MIFTTSRSLTINNNIKLINTHKINYCFGEFQHCLWRCLASVLQTKITSNVLKSRTHHNLVHFGINSIF